MSRKALFLLLLLWNIPAMAQEVEPPPSSPAPAAGGDPSSNVNKDSTDQAVQKDFLQAERTRKAFLATSPGRRLSRRAFFVRGKALVEQYEAIIGSKLPPHAAEARCRILSVLDHLSDHAPRLGKTAPRWLRERTVGSADHRRACAQKLLPATVEHLAEDAAPGFSPPQEAALPSIATCRPADLMLLGRPAAMHLKHCAAYVRAEVRRLLLEARRQVKKGRREWAASLVGRAHDLLPQDPDVRRTRALIHAELGDQMGAQRDVQWLRLYLGEEEGQRMQEAVDRVLAGPPAPPGGRPVSGH